MPRPDRCPPRTVRGAGLAVLLALLGGAAWSADAAPAPPAAPPADPGVAALPPGTPPSPSTAPGIRIWPDPAFTHWPAIAYVDETRNIAFALPNQKPGLAGSIGWTGSPALPITMPAEGDSASGLLPLPLTTGSHAAQVTIGDRTWTLSVRVCDAREPWPLARVQDGFPVDAKGVPVVLLDRRRDADEERRWSLLRSGLPRPAGRALIVGDPMEALGKSPWDGLDADQRIATDQRYPHHAVLVALSSLGQPRTIVWCPGNQALFGAGWSPEEERVLAVLKRRLEALGVMPRLILVAPPIPLDEALAQQARERRDLLISSASAQGWAVIDAEDVCGPATSANRVQDGLFTRYATGPAQDHLAQVLRDEVAR